LEGRLVDSLACGSTPAPWLHSGQAVRLLSLK
jgi:hypothetical protein